MANNGTKRLAGARAYILENWENLSDSAMANDLDTTRNNVAHMRTRLGLKRTPENRRALQVKGFAQIRGTRRPRGYLGL